MLLFLVLLFSPTCKSIVVEERAILQGRKDPHLVLPFEWLHIPKCGTGFGNILLHWACYPNSTANVITMEEGPISFSPECGKNFVNQYSRGARAIWPIGDHVALLPPNMTNYTNVVTFVREPRARTFSHWAMTRASFRDMLNMQAPIDVVDNTVNNFPNVNSWMSDMVMGNLPSHSIQNSLNYTDELKAELCRRVKNFAFVGIVDLWRSSICLFHDKYGGQMKVSDTGVLRPGQYMKDDVLSSGYLRKFRPEPDSTLFVCAIEAFARDVAESRTPLCISELENEMQHVDGESWRPYLPLLRDAVRTFKEAHPTAGPDDNLATVKFNSVEPTPQLFDRIRLKLGMIQRHQYLISLRKKKGMMKGEAKDIKSKSPVKAAKRRLNK